MWICPSLALLNPRLVTKKVGELLPQEPSEGFSTRGRSLVHKIVCMYHYPTTQGTAVRKEVMMTMQVMSGL
jgi:hypothetical protein